MDAARPVIFAAALAVTFAIAACGDRTESKERETAAFVVESEACPDVAEIERREQSQMTAHQHITAVRNVSRLPVAAKSRVCWYRVTYFDPTSADPAEQAVAKHEDSRFCPPRAQWQDLEATRARYLSDYAAAGRMKCFEVPQPNPTSLRLCLKQPDIETFECVEDAVIVAAAEPLNPCQGAGEVLRMRAGTRIVERAAEDMLPDISACFYRVEYDEVVSGKVGSVGGGLR